MKIKYTFFVFAVIFAMAAGDQAIYGQMMGGRMSGNQVAKDSSGSRGMMGGSMGYGEAMQGNQSRPGLMAADSEQVASMMAIMSEIMQDHIDMSASYDSMESRFQSMMKVKDMNKLKAQMKDYAKMMRQTRELISRDMSQQRVMLNLMRDYRRIHGMSMAPNEDAVDPAEEDE